MRNLRLPFKRCKCFVFQAINKNAKYHYLILSQTFILNMLALGALLTGCVNTEGTVKIRGKVLDESTKVQIPGRVIIVKALLEIDNKFVPVDAGQFSTDSAGCFIFSLTKVKDARYYNFFLVGDSDYAFMTRKLGLVELEQNAKYLFFSLSKLADLKLEIEKTSKTPFHDTLYLSVESDGVDFRTLYPYKIDNYGITDNSFEFLHGIGLRWIGGEIKSTVKTRVFADKLTTIRWELVRNRKRKEITDTITCRRDLAHTVYFTY
jgi:hypothetical protein